MVTIIVNVVIFRLRVAVHKIVTFPLFDTVIMVIIALRYFVKPYRESQVFGQIESLCRVFMEQQQNYSYPERERETKWKGDLYILQICTFVKYFKYILS